jgi:hypothetical protein
MYLYSTMQYRQEIPMEEDYRLHLRSRYHKPFRRNAISMVNIGIALLALIGVAFYRKDGLNYYALFLLIPYGLLMMIIYPKLIKHNRHFLKDSEFGFIIKERVTITKVFHTPAGINIYWLDSDDIKTFTPDPYRHFNQGDEVVIYYLKYSKEYLGYDI